MKREKSILIVAAEASSDNYAADVVEAFQQKMDEPVRFFGIGGPCLEKRGVELLFRAEELAVVGGPSEIIGKLGLVFRALRSLRKRAVEERPDLALLLDMPDFNLRLAPMLSKLHVPVLYYISPQVWAWRSARVRILEKSVRKLLAILPFEVEWYRGRTQTLEVSFVGHPLLDRLSPRWNREEMRRRLDCSSEDLLIALLPGSREGEVKALLPAMLEGARIIQKEFSGARFVVPLASTLRRTMCEEIASRYPLDIEIVEDGTYEILNAADFAIVCSGTVTLETALFGVPMVIVYRISPLSFQLGRLLIQTPYMGLVNIIAGRELCPELLQGEVSGEGIAEAVLSILEDPAHYRWIREELTHLRKRLGSPGASQRVVEEMDRLMRSQR